MRKQEKAKWKQIFHIDWLALNSHRARAVSLCVCYKNHYYCYYHSERALHLNTRTTTKRGYSRVSHTIWFSSCDAEPFTTASHSQSNVLYCIDNPITTLQLFRKSHIICGAPSMGTMARLIDVNWKKTNKKNWIDFASISFGFFARSNFTFFHFFLLLCSVIAIERYG